MTVLDFLLGRRLANKESHTRRIGALEAVPAMGLDALGSSAYGPEAALTALMPLGGAAVSCIGWVMAPIVLLLAILFASYWQTIRAYPNNGGAYTVARENLGTNASLLAAAALMIDYVLNVAVGISAGVGALVSAVPALHAYILPLCLGLLALITVTNLRGTPESGRLFALPTYLFVGCFGAILVLGAGAAVSAGGHPRPVVAPSQPSAAAQAVGVWLLLRAFASGCTAMTGVEAVSNSMGTLREPRVKEGHKTLSIIAGILGLLLAGISFLSWAYHIGATDQTRTGYRSVLAQLAAAVIGQGFFYYLAMGSVLSVLALSANTSFVGFPLLCRTVAADGYLPKSFAIAGHRLVFSIGITFLAGFAAVLLSVFGGITDRLIPLFAIGAFLTFTLSQTGMVMHWLRAGSAAGSGSGTSQGRTERISGYRLHLCINAAGAIVTAAALTVIVIAKWAEGAWITVLVIPAVIALLMRIRRYYDELDSQVRASRPLRFVTTSPPVILVATEGWSKLTAEALNFATSLSSNVIAVHLAQLSGPDEVEDERKLREQWQRDVERSAAAAGLEPPKLVIMQAQYRYIHEPVIRLADELACQYPGRRIAVLIPEVIKQHWYQYILHTRRARSLRARLLRDAGVRLTVITVPWRLEEKALPASTSVVRPRHAR
jgi:amino acid transporter